MRTAYFPKIVQTPILDDDDEDELTQFSLKYGVEIETQYKRYLATAIDVKTSEEEEFANHILGYNKNRGLAALPQPLDVNVPWDEEAAKAEAAAAAEAERAEKAAKANKARQMARAKQQKQRQLTQEKAKGGKAKAKTPRNVPSESEED